MVELTQFSSYASKMHVAFQRSLSNIIENPWSEIGSEHRKTS